MFESLEPLSGKEGDICTCVLRFGKVDHNINIGFGMLFGSAVPSFEENMHTNTDSVQIQFKVPPMADAVGGLGSSKVEVMSLFKRGDETFKAEKRFEFEYTTPPSAVATPSSQHPAPMPMPLPMSMPLPLPAMPGVPVPTGTYAHQIMTAMMQAQMLPQQYVPPPQGPPQ